MTNELLKTFKPDEIPASITRKLYVRYGVGTYTNGRISISEHEHSSKDFEAITLCSTELTIAIPEQTQSGIKGEVLKILEEEKAEVLAENHQKLKAVQEKIDNLLAIEYRAEDAA